MAADDAALKALVREAIAASAKPSPGAGPLS